MLLNFVARYLLYTEDHRSSVDDPELQAEGCLLGKHFMTSLKESRFSQFRKFKDFLDGNCFQRIHKLKGDDTAFINRLAAV